MNDDRVLKRQQTLIIVFAQSSGENSVTFCFQAKTSIFISHTLVLTSPWAEFATKTSQDRELGVCCQGLMGSAEEVILPLSLHMVCWGFCFLISTQAKTTAGLASRERKQTSARHLHNVEKFYQKR